MNCTDVIVYCAWEAGVKGWSHEKRILIEIPWVMVAILETEILKV